MTVEGVTYRSLVLTEKGRDAIGDEGESVDLAELTYIIGAPPWDRAFYAVNLETREGGIVLTRAQKVVQAAGRSRRGTK